MYLYNYMMFMTKFKYVLCVIVVLFCSENKSSIVYQHVTKLYLLVT